MEPKHSSRDELRRIRQASVADLNAFISSELAALTEDEALAVLSNRFVTPPILAKVAQNQRLTGFYSVRLALVAHRQTPLAHSTKLVHYLYWFDLIDLSIDVRVPAQVRRAVETQLLNRVNKLSLGEKISSARRCSQALIKIFLFDPDPKVFAALLVNKRLKEDDLLSLIASRRATEEQLQMVARDPMWSYRYPIRMALVLNPATPRAAAASQLRHLRRIDLRRIHDNPETSVYLRRCIERLKPAAARIE